MASKRWRSRRIRTILSENFDSDSEYEILESTVSPNPCGTSLQQIQVPIPDTTGELFETQASFDSNSWDIDCYDDFSISSQMHCDNNDSVSMDDYSCTDEVDSIEEDIRNWSCAHNITSVALSELLIILRNHIPSLPMDSRTLFRARGVTPESSTKIIGSGKYVHFGVASGIRYVLSNCPSLTSDPMDEISLVINVDGVPLFSSSVSGFWVILGAIQNVLDSVFLIGTYFGPSKPQSSNDFLQDLIKELKEIRGVVDDAFNRTVILKWIVCDLPAKKFVKNTTGSSGYFSCDNCTTRGEYNSMSRTVVFPEQRAPRRTDEAFRSRAQEEHHHQIPSEFESISFDMVNGFPLDSLHVLYKGVGLKLLVMLHSGPLNFRLSSSNQKEMTNLLKRICQYVPSDFQRRPRAFQHIKLWKATEVRFFVIYLIPLVLPRFITDPVVMDTFLCFHLICILLNCEHVISDQDNILEQLTKVFYERAGQLIGKGFYSPSVHSLLHLAENYRNFGAVEKFSSFMFENFNRYIKKNVRSPHLPLEQLAKRVTEKGPCLGRQRSSTSRVTSYPAASCPYVSLKPIVPNTLKDCYEFRRIRINSSIKLCLTLRDSFFTMKDNSHKLVACKLVNILHRPVDDTFFLLHRAFRSCENYYEVPIQSSSLGIFRLRHLLPTLKLCSPHSVHAKLFVFPKDTANEEQGVWYASSLLHSLF